MLSQEGIDAHTFESQKSWLFNPVGYKYRRQINFVLGGIKVPKNHHKVDEGGARWTLPPHGLLVSSLKIEAYALYYSDE